MYNRYLRSVQDGYTPIPEDQPHPKSTPFQQDPLPKEATKQETYRYKHTLESVRELFITLTDRFHLDAGDLLLLGILFFLYREKADEELLSALGLLLLL